MPWVRPEQAEGGLAARHARGSHRKRHRYRQLTSAKNEFWRTDDERLVRIVTDVGAVFRFEVVDEIGRWELAGNLDIIKTDPAPTTG